MERRLVEHKTEHNLYMQWVTDQVFWRFLCTKIQSSSLIIKFFNHIYEHRNEGAVNGSVERHWPGRHVLPGGDPEADPKHAGETRYCFCGRISGRREDEPSFI